VSATVPPLGLSNKATSDSQRQLSDRVFTAMFSLAFLQLPLSRSRPREGHSRPSYIPSRYGQRWKKYLAMATRWVLISAASSSVRQVSIKVLDFFSPSPSASPRLASCSQRHVGPQL
jgi:hypothetical protein